MRQQTAMDVYEDNAGGLWLVVGTPPVAACKMPQEATRYDVFDALEEGGVAGALALGDIVCDDEEMPPFGDHNNRLVATIASGNPVQITIYRERMGAAARDFFGVSREGVQ